MKSDREYDDLWNAFRQGSQAAFESIYRHYAPLLFNYGSRICAEQEIVEDSIQDLFVDLWNRRGRMVPLVSVKFYLFKALRYKIYRNRGNTDGVESLDRYAPLLREASFEDLYIELEAQAVRTNRLRDAVEKLPARQREAITLRYFHRFSNEEVSDIMGITYHSACKFIYAGLKKLADELKFSVMQLVILSLVL